ncbi:MAG: 2-hydroxychromene-2-carboxylate isomerase [Woeseiaceae bacterium]|nr:2-hydroxychromene-2-carboxylate isomerase [Woeseiaceae bacterium]
MTQHCRIEFWFEFASTYSYPAAMRIETLALEHGVHIDWRVFLLGPIFKDVGWNDSPFNLYPAKGRYMWLDMKRVCAVHEIPFKRPSMFPRTSLLASRVACRHSDEPWLPQFVKSVYTANFARDRDIAATDVVEECLAGCVADPGKIIKDAQSSQSKNALRERTEEAKDRGVFGAPTFFLGGDMYWGNDRLEMALQSGASN